MVEKICPFCQEVVDEALILDHIGLKHLANFSTAKKPTFKCPDCTDEFPSESDLKCHQSMVHPFFKFACQKCDKQFLTERSCKLHVKMVHTNQVEKEAEINHVANDEDDSEPMEEAEPETNHVAEPETVYVIEPITNDVAELNDRANDEDESEIMEEVGLETNVVDDPQANRGSNPSPSACNSGSLAGRETCRHRSVSSSRSCPPTSHPRTSRPLLLT